MSDFLSVCPTSWAPVFPLSSQYYSRIVFFFFFFGLQPGPEMVLFSYLSRNKHEMNYLITPSSLNVPLQMSIPHWEFFCRKCSLL